MGIVSRGFGGHRRAGGEQLPPGQCPVTGFPVLSAGPRRRVKLDSWELKIGPEPGESRSWDWAAFRALPHEDITVDLHCVTKWSKLGTAWQGVSLDTLLDGVETTAEFALARSYGGYPANLPLADLRHRPALVRDN